MVTALLVLLPLALDPARAAARLDQIRHEFVARPKAESMARLARLADDAPGTPAAARALDWLGDLERTAHHDARAAAAYRRAYAMPDAEGHRLAARGLGDLALDAGRYGEAQRLFAEARAGASGVLAEELRQKIALAGRLRRRALGEWACWAVVGLALAWFAARSRFWARPRPGLPTEALYVAPVYALLLAGCLGRDPAVLHALALLAAWSTALILAAGLAARRAPPAGYARLGHAGLLVVANLALFFAICNRAGIVDTLLATVAP